MTKDRNADRLLMLIGGIRSDIAEEALTTDTGEKLFGGSRRKLKKATLCVASLAACLAIVIATVLSFWGKMTGNAIPDDFWLLQETDFKAIDGIDSLNYYSAKKAISGYGECAHSDLGIALLSNEGENDRVYYALDPSEVFEITKIIAFRIEINNPHNIRNGFLENTLGADITDVIITENSLETMITFKQDENFFSCLLNGTGYTYDENNKRDKEVLSFSTHKFIEGFNIVKSQYETTFCFDVMIKDGRVTDIKCYYGIVSDSTEEYYPDTLNVIEGSDLIRAVSGSFTVGELNAYFGKAKKESDI